MFGLGAVVCSPGRLDDKPAPASNEPRCSQMPSCLSRFRLSSNVDFCQPFLPDRDSGWAVKVKMLREGLDLCTLWSRYRKLLQGVSVTTVARPGLMGSHA